MAKKSDLESRIAELEAEVAVLKAQLATRSYAYPYWSVVPQTWNPYWGCPRPGEVWCGTTTTINTTNAVPGTLI